MEMSDVTKTLARKEASTERTFSVDGDACLCWLISESRVSTEEAELTHGHKALLPSAPTAPNHGILSHEFRVFHVFMASHPVDPVGLC